ncbi:MAG: DcrB-related protein [Clostridia bacterium]|nr:DcrB-related protein [Clostridia bacterium]
MMKKITALLLALLLTLFAASCSADSDAPEDMHSVTVPGEPFILYVPNHWVSNTVSGISSAYYSPTEKILVSARYYTPADQALTVSAYMDTCVAGYSESLAGFALTERNDQTVLGNADAVKITYKITEDGKEFTCFQIAVKHGADLVSLHGYCPTERYELVRADYDSIVANFVLCEKSDPNGAEVVDKKTPEGMEIASADQLEYRLYVPKLWVCNAESGVSEAYYPESEKSNVTVTSYAPSESISVQSYFAQCEAEYRTTLPGYERLSESERTVAERSAYSYTYRTVVDGVEFKIMQTLFAYDSMIYSFTYTARVELFDSHMADVEAMLNAFTFR